MSEYYEEKINLSKNYADRYRDCKILTDKDTGLSLLSTREIKEIPGSPKDQYHRLESHEVNRLDLIAYNYYKNPMLWWVIAQANHIVDPFVDMIVGELIRIPSIESLYGNRGILL